MTNTLLLFTASNFLQPLHIFTKVWFCYERITKKVNRELCKKGFEGRRRLTWKTQAYVRDNVKTDLQKVGCGDMDWIDVAQDRDR